MSCSVDGWYREWLLDPGDLFVEPDLQTTAEVHMAAARALHAVTVHRDELDELCTALQPPDEPPLPWARRVWIAFLRGCLRCLPS
jgi:hypothetical protein